MTDQTRVVRNTARVGKPWLVVQGHYKTTLLENKKRWITKFQVSEHDTKQQALDSLKTTP